MHEALCVKATRGAEYPVFVGKGAMQHAAKLIRARLNAKVAIVADANVAKLHLPALLEEIGDASSVHVITVPSGENSKSIASYVELTGDLLERNFRRDSMVVALGGGVVGDLTGFVASTLLRGIDYFQIPTTLLAQIDSAIGGKTGINHLSGKNLIGAVHQPKAVFCDLGTLDTLPNREYFSGMAEIVKYGLAFDKAFFLWLQENAGRLVERDPECLETAIRKSIAYKAEVVFEDEMDTGGRRSHLNLGHTFAHAIENAMGYQEILHGEAVAIGLVAAAELSCRESGLASCLVNEIKSLINIMSLPTIFPDKVKNGLIPSMASDKKFDVLGMRFVLLRDIGDVYLARINEDALEQAVQAVGFA